MVIYGAYRHGGMIIEILENHNREVCFYDDDPAKQEYLKTRFLKTLESQEEIIIGIGDNDIRRIIAEKLSGSSFTVATDKTTNISSGVKIGTGSVVFKGGFIIYSSKIGKLVIINTKASIDHDCFVGDFSQLYPALRFVEKLP